MKLKKMDLRKEMRTAMAAAYCQHLEEAAKDPTITKETWEDFFSPYGPAPDDDSLIEFFARRASDRAQEKRNRETGGSGH